MPSKGCWEASYAHTYKVPGTLRARGKRHTSVCSVTTCLVSVSSWVSGVNPSSPAFRARSQPAATTAELQLPACRGALTAELQLPARRAPSPPRPWSAAAEVREALPRRSGPLPPGRVGAGGPARPPPCSPACPGPRPGGTGPSGRGGLGAWPGSRRTWWTCAATRLPSPGRP